MGQKELLRGKALDVGKQGKKTLKAAAMELKIICRQGIRLLRAYQEGGDATLIHSLSGRHRAEKRRKLAASGQWNSTGSVMATLAQLSRRKRWLKKRV
jgi:hypothetical protein